MSVLGFEPMIPVFELAKTVLALDLAAVLCDGFWNQPAGVYFYLVYCVWMGSGTNLLEYISI
jgi:hypothetical protein